MKRNDWVASHDQIGKIKTVHREKDETFIDVIIFDRNGNQLGRTSPVEGGPKTFEPFCDAANWKVIEKPIFPLSRYAYIEEVVKFVRDPAE